MFAICCHDNGKTAWVGKASVAWTLAWLGKAHLWTLKITVFGLKKRQLLGYWEHGRARGLRRRDSLRFSSDLRFSAEQRSSGSSRSSFSLSLAPAAGTAPSFEAMSTPVSEMPSPTLSPYIDAAIFELDSDSDVQIISTPVSITNKRKASPEVNRDTKKRKAVQKVISDDDRSTVTPATPANLIEAATGLTSLNEPEIEAWDEDHRDQFRSELERILHANMLTAIVDEKLKSSYLHGADTEEDSDDSEDVVRQPRKQSRRKVLPDTDDEDDDDDDSTVTPHSPLLRPVDSANSQRSDDEIEAQQGLESESELFPVRLTVQAASEDYTIYLPNEPQQQSVVRVHDRPYSLYKIDINPELTERCGGGLVNMTAYGRCLEDPSKSSFNYKCPNGSAQIDHLNKGALQAMSLLNDYKSSHTNEVSDKDKAIFRSVVELLKQTDMIKPFSDYACFSQRFQF